MKNLCGKTKPQDKPYMIFKSGSWEWVVLKTYQSREAEVKNPYARWFLATTSPHTYGSAELADGYAANIQHQGLCVFLSPEAVAAGYTAGAQLGARAPKENLF